LKTINLQENALLIKQEEFQQAYERLLAEIESFRERKAEKTKLEVSAMLDNIQNTLADLRSKREQNELLSEHQQQRLTQIGNEVQRILKNVHHLSHERRST
jgi:molecular chaperone GrpE (heat shock protein)